MLPVPPRPEPITKPAPLPFVLVWNGFVTVHAFFMIGAFWKQPAVIGLLLLYSLFFGVGGWMALSWWRWSTFTRRYGTPTVKNWPAVRPGDTATISLAFNRVWPSGQKPVAVLQWAQLSRDSDGESRQALAQTARELTAATFPHRDGTDWQCTLTVPSPPATAPASLRLELLLQAPGSAGTGWRIPLPLAADAAPGNPAALTLTPADRDKVLKLLGSLSTGLMVAAMAVLGVMVADGRLAFTDLLFPVFMGFGGWYLRGVRAWMTQQRGWENGMKPDTAALQARFKRTGAVLPLLMVGLFAADLLLPDDVIGTLKKLNGVERPEAPSTQLGHASPAPAAGETTANGDLWQRLENGETEAARTLIRAQPGLLDAETARAGFNAAHMTAYSGHVDTLRMLLDEGVDVNAVNNSAGGRGETLLMAAARSQRNSVALIDLLLSRGARLDALDRYGKNATDWAEFFHVPEASDELCRRGLEPTPLDASSPNNEVRKRARCAEPAGGR
jgi:hypothetical protein